MALGCWGEDSNLLRLNVSANRCEAGPNPASRFLLHHLPRELYQKTLVAISNRGNRLNRLTLRFKRRAKPTHPSCQLLTPLAGTNWPGAVIRNGDSAWAHRLLS